MSYHERTLPLTDFLSPAEIEAKFRKRYGVRAEVGLWLAIGVVALGVTAYFWGLYGPKGPRLSADGKVTPALVADLERQFPRLSWQPGLVDLSRPLLFEGHHNLIAPRWWRLARFNPAGRSEALKQGITAAVPIGDPLEWSVTLEGAIDDGRLAGPRVAPALVLCAKDRSGAWEEGAARALAPQSAGNAVRDAVAQGARVLVLDALTSMRVSAYDIAVTTAAAHGLGRKVAVLAGSAAAVADAAQAGADVVVGLPAETLPDWVLTRLLERKVVVAPAVSAVDAAARPQVAANAYRLYAAGVPLALATAGRPAAEELEALARTGIPRAALAGFAEVGGGAIGLPVGGTAAGRVADLVGVDGSGRVQAVVAGGTRVRP